VIVIAFAYASNKLQDTHRYLSNLVRYTISNYLVSLKILSTEQVKQNPEIVKVHP
jgi:hypothetical protein